MLSKVLLLNNSGDINLSILINSLNPNRNFLCLDESSGMISTLLPNQIYYIDTKLNQIYKIYGAQRDAFRVDSFQDISYVSDNPLLPISITIIGTKPNIILTIMPSGAGSNP